MMFWMVLGVTGIVLLQLFVIYISNARKKVKAWSVIAMCGSQAMLVGSYYNDPSIVPVIFGLSMTLAGVSLPSR